MYRWIEFFGVEASSRFHILFVPFFLSLRIRKKESFEREKTSEIKLLLCNCTNPSKRKFKQFLNAREGKKQGIFL